MKIKWKQNFFFFKNHFFQKKNVLFLLVIFVAFAVVEGFLLFMTSLLVEVCCLKMKSLEFEPYYAFPECRRT